MYIPFAQRKDIIMIEKLFIAFCEGLLLGLAGTFVVDLISGAAIRSRKHLDYDGDMYIMCMLTFGAIMALVKDFKLGLLS